MMTLGLSSTSDVITFDQNWHHLCSTSAGREDLSSDAQIRVIGRLDPEICTKMLKKWSEKLRPKFPATTPGCSMVKIPRLNDAFLEVFQLQASPLEGQSLQQKGEKRRKRKGEKKFQKSKKPQDIGHFLVQKILISVHAHVKMS